MSKPDLDHLPTIIVSDTSGDAGATINNAIKRITFNGTRPGRVVLLAGTYNVVSRIWMTDGLVLQGQPDWSARLVNLQTQGFGDGSFGFTGIAIGAWHGLDLDPASTVRLNSIALVDMCIDVRSITNFYTAISIAYVANVWIEHCFFDNSMTPPYIFNNPWTIHAVLIDQSGDVVVTRCRTRYSQLKTATTGAGTTEVSYCTCENSTNFSMSHVLQSDGDLGHYRAIGNYCVDPYGQGGIYVGNDHTNQNYGIMRSCRIENNIVEGTWQPTENGSGMQVRPLLQNGSIDIIGNVIVNRTPGALPNNGYGIPLKAQVQDTVTEVAHVYDNYCEYADREGIYISGGFRDLVLRGNQCYRTRAPQILVETGNNHDHITVRTIDSITPVVKQGAGVDDRGGT